MAEWLAQKDFQVRIVTAAPYYPEWKVAEGYSPWRYKKETIDGVEVIRCPFFVPQKPTGLTRILHLASFAISSFPIMLWSAIRWHPDVVLVIAPAFTCAPTAWLVSRLSGAFAWLHIQDFEIDAAFQLGILRMKLLRRFISALERWIMCRFDRVSTISNGMMKRLSEKGVREEKSLLFQNWVDTDMIKPLNSPSGLRASLGIPDDAIVVLYSGNMGKKQGLEIIPETARKLNGDDRFLFVMCGDGVARAAIEKQARGMPNIKFIPLQPIERLNELMNIADIHLLPQRINAEDLVMPSKLITILSSGKPVIVTARVGTELESYVSGCGIVTEPGDTDAIKEAILDIAFDSAKSEALGKKGRACAIENWSKENVLRHAFKFK